MDVVDDVDPLKIKILTKGLENPTVGTEMKFAVCTVGAGNGDLKVCYPALSLSLSLSAYVSCNTMFLFRFVHSSV